MLKPKRANIFALILIIFTILTPFIMAYTLPNTAGSDKAEIAAVTLQDVFMILLPVVLYCIIFRTKLTDVVPHERLTLKNAGYVTLLTLLVSPIISLVSSVTALFYSADINADMLSSMNKMPTLLAVFAMAVMPAVFEELAFRGIILSNMKSRSIAKAAAASALMFGLFHMDFYQMGYAIVAGFFFALLVAQTNSIFSSMLSHFLINGVQVLNVKLMMSAMSSIEREQLISAVPTAKENLMAVLVSFMFFVVTFPILLFVIRRFMRYNRTRYIDYMFSLGNGKASEFELEIANISKQKKIVDVYFVIYVVITLVLAAGLAVFNHMQ